MTENRDDYTVVSSVVCFVVICTVFCVANDVYVVLKLP